jgi:hypothetical protein
MLKSKQQSNETMLPRADLLALAKKKNRRWKAPGRSGFNKMFTHPLA